MRKLKVLHIITSLDKGGAEAVLCRLVGIKSEDFEFSIISLMGEGYYSSTIRDIGCDFHPFKFTRFFRLKNLVEFVRLVRLISIISPNVIQTWLYHADLIGGVAARLAGFDCVIWGIRSSAITPANSSFFTRLVVWFSARLSCVIPCAISTCSTIAAEEHIKLGYDKDKFIVIPNGFNLISFSPNRISRDQVRKEWGFDNEEVLFGCVARWDPYKDYPNLFEALSLLIHGGKSVRCVLVGGGLSHSNHILIELLLKFKLTNHVILADFRNDIPAVMNAFDFHILPSASEAFPNVVAEAMACQTPCIVTNVGDASMIVGDTGWVVHPNNPFLLSQAIHEASCSVGSESDLERRIKARQRIENNFTLKKMADSYYALWKKIFYNN